ncbi:NAD(P)-binding domain-containing protein [Vibrio sp. OCN044]|uniref:2-dehydropantoate 2-reductase n=1 Tax=Vibrio tetraodonis subsp. pristinus TaxID=2695891 RepID=A0A6L8LT86_9VIBR|nr:2-dehydropantoate 2-reductase N-terminal domain-containing protein [Vibrio tetraodonis]MYM58905.1 NAD(P)-binding domain-containing protein [Vibrio tetraodonis subsp. pristinus]
MPKVSIIGLGSLGGFVAARLSSLPKAQIQWILGSSERSGEVQLDGKVPILAQADSISHNIKDINGEIVFLTIKTYHNKKVFHQLKALKNKTIVLLQNGIGEDEKLAKCLDSSNCIVSATTHIKASYTSPPYTVTLHNDIKDCLYTIYQGQPSKHLKAVFKHVFDEVMPLPTAHHVRLPKLLISFAANAASFVYDSDMQGLAQSSLCRELMLNIEEEFLNLFEYHDIPRPEFDITRLISILDNPSYKGSYFSMKEDYDEGRKVEFEAIFKTTCDLAALHNIPFSKSSTVSQNIEDLITTPRTL